MKQIQITNSTDYEYDAPHMMVDNQRPRVFYDIVTKYSDEPNERIKATVGSESRYCEDILGMFDEPKLEYIRIELSTFWKNKRDEHYAL